MDTSPCRLCTLHKEKFPYCISDCSFVKEFQKEITNSPLKGIDTSDEYPIHDR